MAVKKKHTVFLLNIPPQCTWGGCEGLVLALLAAVDYRHQRVSLVVTKDEFSERIQKLELPVQVTVIEDPIQGSRVRELKLIGSVLRRLRADAAVFVHNGFLQFLWPSFLTAWMICQGRVYSFEVLGAPKPPEKIRKRIWGFLPALNCWWYAQMWPVMWRGHLSRGILCVSREVRRLLLEWYAYPPQRVKAVYHGIDPERFAQPRDTSPLRRQLGIAPSDRVILNHGRLSPQKCLGRAVRAFDRLHGEFPDTWLVFVGDGELREELEHLAGRQASRDRIRFLGFQSRVDDYLCMADYYVLPSDNEGFSCSMVEALGAGLISVITAAPGADECVDDGYNGFLVERSDEGVYDGLRRALTLNESQRTAMSAAAQATVRERFNVKVNIGQELAVLGLQAKATTGE